MSRSALATALVIALTSAVLFLAGALTYHIYSTPDCPEEDSCTVDYYDNKWHIQPTD